MGRLIYLTLSSLDGFIGDGDFSRSTPNEERDCKTDVTDPNLTT